MCLFNRTDFKSQTFNNFPRCERPKKSQEKLRNLKSCVKEFGVDGFKFQPDETVLTFVLTQANDAIKLKSCQTRPAFRLTETTIKISGTYFNF